MLRALALAATIALVTPGLSAAQDHHDEHHQGGPPPHPAGPPPHPPGPPPGFAPHGPPAGGAMMAPHPPGPPAAVNREMGRPDHPAEHPMERSVEHPFDRPPERSVERPFERPMNRPMDGSVERPMDRRMGPPPGTAEFSHRDHDREVERVHARPFFYPPGYGYRRWEVGAALPPVFLMQDYWYADWDALGLDPPPPGYQWVRYGPDLLLVDVTTGQVAEVEYDVFYE
jgi:Ni/Co efflux regulator RcnB